VRRRARPPRGPNPEREQGPPPPGHQPEQLPTCREVRNAALYQRNPSPWPFQHLKSDHGSPLLTVISAAPAMIRVKLCHAICVSDEADRQQTSPVTCNQRKPVRFSHTNSSTALPTHGTHLSRRHRNQRFSCSVAVSGQHSPASHGSLYMRAGIKSC